MLKSLSRVLGITGGALTMLPYITLIAHCVKVIITSNSQNDMAGEGKGLASAFLLMYAVPALLSSSGIIASLFVRKRPIIAGVVMALSAGLNIISPPGYYASFVLRIPPEVADAARIPAALLLVLAGSLAIISYKKTPHEPKNDKPGRAAALRPSAVRRTSRIAAVICAALNMLPLLIFSIYILCRVPELFLLYWAFPLVISSVGLWGSLLLLKKPVLGAVMTLVSGGLVFLIESLYYPMIPYWWLCIPPLLLIAAGIFALISTSKVFISKKLRKTTDPALSEKRRLMLKNISRIIGIICASFHVLFWVILAVRLIVIWPDSEPYQQKLYSSELVPFLIIPILFSITGLWGSLLHKKPLPGAMMMLFSGGAAFILMLIDYFGLIWQNIPSLLLAAAGILALVSANKTSGVKKPQNERPDSPC